MMQSYVFLIQCILYPLLSISLDIIDFDAYGNKYFRVRLGSNDYRKYQMSLNRDEYIYMLGASSINHQLIHVNTNITFDYKLDDRSRPYYLLEPSNTENICDTYDNNDCTFNLIVTNTQATSRSVSLRFNKNVVAQSGKVYSNKVKLRKRRRYGMMLQQSQLPILVTLIPNQKYKKMDIDLYAYSEKSFTSYYFPNRAERNHIHNYQEQLIIVSADSYFHDQEWHFFEVYGSTDSDYEDMDYTVKVQKNFQYDHEYIRYNHYNTNIRIDEPDNLLKKILLIFAFTVASSFVCGIFISFFCAFRHQILFCLRIRSTPHPNGASKKQIKKLKIISYKQNMIEDIDSTQCIICLDDYTENDKIRILKCNHAFHKHCSDEWLYQNDKCPLCNQNIVDAQNVHNSTSNIEMTELALPEDINQEELQELQSDATSLIPHSLSNEPHITLQ
eukprot:129541_1